MSWAQLPEDIISTILQHCFANGYVRRVLALAYINQHYHKIVSSRVKEIDLKLICPLLDILDAKRLGIKVEDEPPLNKLEAIKLYNLFAPCIERNKGLAIVTMTEKLTFRNLVDLAAEKEIKLTINWAYISSELEHDPVKATYRVIMSNNIVKKIVEGKGQSTRAKQYKVLEKLVLEIGFDQIPTPQEQLALCLYQLIFNNKRVYGQNPLTYGITKNLNGSSLLIGNCASQHLDIIFHVADTKHRGAGGRRKLQGFGQCLGCIS